MPYLVILKRLEVWLLIGVVAAVLSVAFRSDSDVPEPSEPGPVAVLPDRKGEKEKEPVDVGNEEGILVENVDVTETGSGKIVELTLLGSSPGEGEVVIDDSNLLAMTESGEPVRAFFEPFREVQVLQAGQDSLVTVKYWLESEVDVLWLDFEGTRLKAELP